MSCSMRCVLFLFVMTWTVGMGLQAQEVPATTGDGLAPATAIAAAHGVPATPAPDLDDSVWRDAKTGLIWQRDAADRDMTAKQADEYCDINRRDLPGADWRLPSIDELKTLLKTDKHGGCPWPSEIEGPCGIYWSGSKAKSRGEGHYIDFSMSIADYDDRGFAYHIRCVRKP